MPNNLAFPGQLPVPEDSSRDLEQIGGVAQQVLGTRSVLQSPHLILDLFIFF